MKRIAVLGSTGSIGRQTLDVLARHPQDFSAYALAAHSDAEGLFAQVRAFRPRVAGLVAQPKDIPEDLRSVEWVFGQEAVNALAGLDAVDAVLLSVVGMAGLPPALLALSRGKDLLLATKEALVVGGALVRAAAEQGGARILPVDSEHSAIFQCLEGAGGNRPEQLILTASGGPFRTWEAARIERATAAEALRHPTWNMGRKISIDSATMMNKGLEVIEAHHLFDMPAERMEVLIHPQSIIHSMVSYGDGSVIAQLGSPDMRVPIAYALSYPARIDTGAARLNLAQLGTMTFEAPDFQRFPCLALAFEALRAGGSAPCALNAANEAAVAALLDGRIRVGGIARIVSEVLQAHARIARPDLQQLMSTDAWARGAAEALIKKEQTQL